MRRLVFLLWLLPAGAAAGQDMPLSQVLIDGEGWKEVRLPDVKPSALAADGKGRLILVDSGDRLVRWADGKTTTYGKRPSAVAGLCFGKDGGLYTSVPKQKAIVFQGQTGGPGSLFDEAVARDVAVSPAGKVYFIDPVKKAVFLLGRKDPVATEIGDPAGLAFWKDGGTLVVGDAAGKHLYAFRVGDDGGLDAREKYYPLRVRPKEPSGVRALVIDDDRRLYAATNLGVQVFDPTGRTCGVINPPLRQPVTAIAFAGEKRDQLFIVCGGKLWQRKTKAKAAWPPDPKAK
jgi:enterochelin esterase family protein